jgi:hypothetical protein
MLDNNLIFWGDDFELQRLVLGRRAAIDESDWVYAGRQEYDNNRSDKLHENPY